MPLWLSRPLWWLGGWKEYERYALLDKRDPNKLYLYRDQRTRDGIFICTEEATLHKRGR